MAANLVLQIKDIEPLMGYPIFAFSKNRREPIVYEQVGNNGCFQSIITSNSDHYIASIYDWDIIIVLAGIYQEKLNIGCSVDRKICIERSYVLKRMGLSNRSSAHHRLKGALNRLQSTSVKIISEAEKIDSRIIDSWIFTDRKDIVEIEIVLSNWIFQHICKNGNLLKIEPEYFELTSGIERFLYRTGRKYLGKQERTLILVETLYKKSGSEDSISFFKRDLKKKVKNNNIPFYDMEWIEMEGKTYVSFSKSKRTKWEPSKKDRTESWRLTLKNRDIISAEPPLQKNLNCENQSPLSINEKISEKILSMSSMNESDRLDEITKDFDSYERALRIINVMKTEILKQMTQQVISQMKAHHQTGNVSWTYETAVKQLPVQVGCLTKLVMQMKGEQYAYGLLDEELKIRISDELADIMSLILFVAHELDVDMGSAWDKMIKCDVGKVEMRSERFLKN